MLVVLPPVDSPALAAARRSELAIDRRRAAFLGEEAVAAIERGAYPGPDGREVPWGDLVDAARRGKESIPPDEPLPDPPGGVSFPVTRVQVTNETTLGAARRLARAGRRPLALNFANGVRPGGGFLRGARAQEEALCRSSALYATLAGDRMYAAHARRPLPDFSDWVILSPRVPVFRDDDGTTLPEPWLLDVATCAAPYAPGVGTEAAAALLDRRIRRLLAVARSRGYGTLVLGAWGCGAFGNDPARTARSFRDALAGEFDGAFEEVVFAIADWSPGRRTLGPFRDVFGED